MTGRIRFANQLRGIAALMVACSHLIGVYWVLPDVVSAATSSPAQSGALPGIFWIVGNPWINFGPLGVALFFLISGFVIPFSLETHTRTTFLLARLLRIYPTYALALVLEMAVIYAASSMWERPFGYSAPVIAGNALLIYDLIGQPSVDLVNWTLSVELKFYLLVALLAPAIRRGSMVTVAGVALCIFACNLLAGPGSASPGSLRYTLSAHSLCLIYMLLGTAFNAHLRGLIRTPALILTLGLLSGLFLATWTVSAWAEQFPVVTANYLYGFVVFTALYAGRRWVPANPLLDALAAISFPFYVVHSLFGYSVLRALMAGAGWGYYPALTVALAVVIGTATGLHFAVERPSTRLGRRLAGGESTDKKRKMRISTLTAASNPPRPQ